VADEIDALDAGRSVGHPGTGEQHIDRAATLGDGGVDRLPLSQVDVDGLGPGQGDLGEVHDHHLGSGVQDQLGGGGTHAGGATDHEDPLPVVAKCVKERHVRFSCLGLCLAVWCLCPTATAGSTGY